MFVGLWVWDQVHFLNLCCASFLFLLLHFTLQLRRLLLTPIRAANLLNKTGGSQQNSHAVSLAWSATRVPGLSPPWLQIGLSFLDHLCPKPWNSLPPCFHINISRVWELRGGGGWSVVCFECGLLTSVDSCSQEDQSGYLFLPNMTWLPTWKRSETERYAGRKGWERTLQCLCCCPLFTNEAHRWRSTEMELSTPC